MTDPSRRLPMTPGPGVFRFLHTSDWQLGMDRWFLGEEAGPRYREARLAAVERLLDVAKARQCAAVVVAGDVFDDNLVDPVTWRRTVDILRRSPVPVFLLPGNHDPYDAASVYRSRDFDELTPAVQVLNDSRPRTVPGTTDGSPTAEIIGAPLLSKYMSTDPVASVLARAAETGGPDHTERAEDRTVKILVGHGATESRSSGEDPAVIDVDAAARACRDGVIDMLALGDTHSVTSLHPDGTVWYSGSPEVTDFREEGGGGEARSGYALVVDVLPASGKDAGRTSQVSVEEVKTGRWSFLALAAQINSREDVAEWINRLEDIRDKRTTVVKYTLTGSVDLATAAVLDEELDRIAPAFAALYPRRRLMDLHVVPGDEELADADWPGVVGVAARGLADRASHDAAARDALRLLYRLSAQKGN
ncbi:metallophosphoesterase family protein [Corynebacterium glyciniphilum]|uniref:metallophosphoesterase family protein n=1 Tax=Corynebacterium glyciniphilum TaxID=1404244 RepID=UPI003DA0A126